jgi:hypothetical protein
MPISPELKRVYASAPQDARYIETLELSHSRFPRTIYITNDLQQWEFLLEDSRAQLFQIVPFKVILPTSDGKGNQDLSITIDNIGREAVEALELASGDPTENIAVVYRVYLDRSFSAPQTDPPLRLTLTNVVVTLDAITGAATRADTLNRPFPSVLYRTDTFPGLDR